MALHNFQNSNNLRDRLVVTRHKLDWVWLFLNHAIYLQDHEILGINSRPVIIWKLRGIDWKVLADVMICWIGMNEKIDTVTPSFEHFNHTVHRDIGSYYPIPAFRPIRAQPSDATSRWCSFLSLSSLRSNLKNTFAVTYLPILDILRRFLRTWLLSRNLRRSSLDSHLVTRNPCCRMLDLRLVSHHTPAHAQHDYDSRLTAWTYWPRSRFLFATG